VPVRRSDESEPESASHPGSEQGPDGPDIASGSGDAGVGSEQGSGDADAGVGSEEASGDADAGVGSERASGDADAGVGSERASGDADAGVGSEEASGDADAGAGSDVEAPSGTDATEDVSAVALAAAGHDVSLEPTPAPGDDHTPRHAATGRSPYRSRSRVAVIVGVALMLVAAGISMSSALSGDDEPTEATRAPTTERETTTSERPTTTAAPTTTVPETTTTTAAPTTTTTAPPTAASDGKLELGESGEAVAALQRRLIELGYWMGEPDGTYGQLTRQAVMAFQKVEGLGRDGVAGPVTQERLASAGRPAARTGGGIEIDLDRQVLFVVQAGSVQWAINTSTGNGEAYTSSAGGAARAVTPPGSFVVQREIDGLREAPLGTLYRPKYFNGGIAVHGSGSIPAFPASHGCARVTNSAMDMLWASGAMAIGTPVTLY
jgi:peptidoglycan hydrolase-like protein with peptidoglycan-binding domain